PARNGERYRVTAGEARDTDGEAIARRKFGGRDGQRWRRRGVRRRRRAASGHIRVGSALAGRSEGMAAVLARDTERIARNDRSAGNIRDRRQRGVSSRRRVVA